MSGHDLGGRDFAGMRLIPGGTFAMGSERFYPEEAPVRQVRVNEFLIDEVPVTNAAFAAFVQSTGYVTLAERKPDPAAFPPGSWEHVAVAGSIVFDDSLLSSKSRHGANPGQWWFFRPGADWRRPMGPGSSIDGLLDHPVVHVAHEDAEAYAHWAGKSLPTEAEWECAARGGLEGAEYAWGNELAPHGAMLANYWQGAFPYENLMLDGWARTSPVRSFPPNGYGLYDTIGNVWEWTSDWWALPIHGKQPGSCCVPLNPKGGAESGSYEPGVGVLIPRKVIKGGSHLCAANYCQRYRPAARHPQAIDSSTSHIGFRCVVR